MAAPAPAPLRGGAATAGGVEKSLTELGAAPGPARPFPLPAGAGLLGAVGNVVHRPDRDHAPAVAVEGKLPESWKIHMEYSEIPCLITCSPW